MCSGETDPASLQTLGQHDNMLDLVLPDHPPEVSYCVWHGAWAEREIERERERESVSKCVFVGVCGVP